MTSNKLEKVRGGACAPKGFRCAAVSCGIKDPTSDRLDLALIYSKYPTVGAAVFTQNEVVAAPVRLSSNYIKTTEPRAIIANSGNANACTGPAGMEHARRMAAAVSAELGIKQREVQVCSTGIIGVPLPIERIEAKVPELVAGLTKHQTGASQAIMTSDTRPKSCSVKLTVNGEAIRIGAIAKGAGMINPHMATMLCFVTTDAAVTKAELKAATEYAVGQSFNRISVDGDMSTNDTVVVMANQRAGNQPITRGGNGSEQFREALAYVMTTLAKKIVSDGERVTKLVEVRVRGASNLLDAQRVARAVSNSNLVKCSWNGEDPNWGRIIHAVGYSGARVKEEMVDIFFDGFAAAKNGIATEASTSDLLSVVRKKEFTVGIDLNLGAGEFHMYTSDLSPEYVEFNRAEYAAHKMKK